MKRAFYFFFILTTLLFSCDKPERKGDLNVTVVVNGYYPAENAFVYTKPSSRDGITDEFGSVLLKGIETGSYEVYANMDNIGSGKSAVNIKADELNEVTINVIQGIFTGEAPTISINSPVSPAEFYEDENIYFSALIEDDETPPQDISVEWFSDLDGVIFSGNPDQSGLSSFNTNSLSKGVHLITVKAVDEDDFQSSKTIQVSTNAIKGVTLNTPELVNGNVVLKWTKFEGSDFLMYEVFRTDENCSDAGKELLATIGDINQTSFTDSLVPLAYQACYFIRVTNIQDQYRNSNTQLVNLPDGHLFNFIPSDFLKHPTEKIIYLVDKGGQKLIKFNYELMQVSDEVNLQGTVGYCDIGDNGFGYEIYIPGNDGWIYVYNAADLSLVTSILTGLPTASCVVNGLGHVIASVQPSPWWEQPVRTYSRATGINLDGNGDFERDRLRMIPGKNELISISTTVSPVDMEYFRLDENGMIVLHQDDQYHGDYPLNPNIFRISDNGEYAITASEGAVYLANSSMEYKGQLQHGTLSFSDFAFSDDGSVIYAGTSNRKSVQIGHYPSLIRDDEILTKGFPKFVLRDGQRLILLSIPEDNSTISGIEIIDLQAI